MTETLLLIFRRLYEHFGPRHWWPADTPLEMIIGAILTQNVSWKSASAAIANLKKAGLLSVEALAEAEPEALADLLRPARYHMQKARKVQAFCRVVKKECGGDLRLLLNRETGELRQRLLDIYGIGPETADAIILYAAGQPIFVIDAYTRRIFQRLGYFPEKVSYREMQQFFMQHLASEVALYNEYHAQIDALGHHVCLKTRPRCGVCPLADLCRYRLEAEASDEGKA